jgi:hypothetical protein
VVLLRCSSLQLIVLFVHTLLQLCGLTLPLTRCSLAACRTAEDLLLGSAGDTAGVSNHSLNSADESNRQQQQRAGHGGDSSTGNGQLTPSQGRYNLHSCTHSTPQQGNSANGAAEDLVKPLLTDAAEDHHAHEHGHDEHLHAHGHDHGCTAGHSVSVQQQHSHVHLAHTHHHAVVVGDLRQGVVLLVAMVVHTFLECMALGLMVSVETVYTAGYGRCYKYHPVCLVCISCGFAAGSTRMLGC